MEEEDQVMSEVHLGCPPHLRGTHLSYFTFPFPFPFPFPAGPEASTHPGNQESVSLDEDGDLLLLSPRPPNKPSRNCQIAIQHNITSTIPSVGLQVWRAELVLADFVLHCMCTSNMFHGAIVLELGAGTGLLGILLAGVARTVFLTDHGDDILDNCAVNVHLNSEIYKKNQTSVYVRELDWNNSWPPSVGLDDLTIEKSNKYSWGPLEVEEAENVSLLFAADVIYSDELTDAFFSTLSTLMSRGSSKVLYLALEKRYNFSVNDLDVVANGYSHFLSYLKNEEECQQQGNKLLPCFVGKQIDHADIPQYVREYNRENNVEIWQIEYLTSEGR